MHKSYWLLVAIVLAAIVLTPLPSKGGELAKDAKILIVDDAKSVRKIIVSTLAKIGYSAVEQADGGPAALAKLRDPNLKIGLVITDWNMPEMTGVEMIKSIRKDFPNLPILMVATNSAKEDIVEALQTGVNGYIVKPFTPETMKEKIASVL